MCIVVNSYGYAAAGNQTTRVGHADHALKHDPENHLISLSGGSASATFAYNGDGQRAWATINGVTNLYSGLIEYQINTSTLTKYYDVGGQRVAVRNGSSLNYLLHDHLGSTSVILKTNGALWGELRYAAWGEIRYSNGTIVTDRQFTGQINDGATGLYYYNARYYDPALARFIQAGNDQQNL